MPMAINVSTVLMPARERRLRRRPLARDLVDIVLQSIFGHVTGEGARASRAAGRPLHCYRHGAHIVAIDFGYRYGVDSYRPGVHRARSGRVQDVMIREGGGNVIIGGSDLVPVVKPK